jgi:hypothetical protein
MEPEGSLPCSQEPSTVPDPDPHQSSLYHSVLSSNLSTIHINIMLSSTSMSSQ